MGSNENLNRLNVSTNYYFRDAQGNVLSIYQKSATFGQSYFFCEEQTLYGSARLGTEQVEHSMRGLVTNDVLTDEITRAREQHGDNWQSHLQQQYDGQFYERLQEAWGNEWNTRLDLVLQGNHDGWLIEQIRNESYTLQVGNKRYELSNHLGNVLAVVSDKKEQSDGVTWSAIVVSAQDYFPFGMAMPGRSTDAKHRYGFNGKETDPETGLNDFGARLYDSRLGRWLAIDPLAAKFSAWSPYNSMNNNPLFFTDPDGMQVDGDYYGLENGKIKPLGTDNVKDGKQYFVANEKKFGEATKAGLNENTTKTLLAEKIAAEIVVEIPGTTEGQYFEKLYNDGMGMDMTTCKELSVTLLLDVTDFEKPKLTVHKNSSKYNSTFWSFLDSDEIATQKNPRKIILGSAHTHQVAWFDRKRDPIAGTIAKNHQGDNDQAATSGRLVYAIDYQGIDVHVPTSGLPGFNATQQKVAKSYDLLESSSELYENKFSILRDALSRQKVNND